MTWTNLLGQVRVGIRGSVSQSQTQSLLLDTYSGAAAAYSLRKLNTSYTGYAIRVRRSSDNTEQNIGFNADGTLNTLSLLAFVGSGNGFVTTWYDQSGNGRNVTQTTASNQPSIASSGSLFYKNGKPAIDFTSGQTMKSDNRVIGIDSTSVFNVFSIKSLTNRGVAWDIGKNDISYHFYALDVNTWQTSGQKFGFYTSVTAFDTDISTNLNQNLVSIISNNTVGTTIRTNTSFYLNNRLATLSSSSAQYTNFTTASRITFGDFNGAYSAPFAGTHQEFIVYQTNKTSDRVSISNNINSYYSIYSTDTDAQAFINAASITDGTQIRAIDTLVTSLKSAGIWTKMKAIYPFVGGTAAQHQFNLKDPRSVDAAFYLTFYGGVTHTNLGVNFNGTTGYADMKLTRSQVFTNIDGIIGMYTPTTTLSTPGAMFGVTNMLNADFAGLYDGTSLKNLMYPTTALTYTTSLQGFNWFGVDINTTTHRSIFKNGVRVAFADGYSAISPDHKVYMAAVNRAGTSYGDNFAGIYSFAFASNTLNSTEALAFYNAVQTYQTTLGRQV